MLRGCRHPKSRQLFSRRCGGNCNTRPKSMAATLSDREIIRRYVERVVVNPNSIWLTGSTPVEAAQGGVAVVAPNLSDAAEAAWVPGTVISVPWDAPAFVSVKGILHRPTSKAVLKPETRNAILLAIAKARCWIDDLASGRVELFAEIAEREGKVERHVRLLAPLAFTPPAMLAEIIKGTASAGLTVTALAQDIPHEWGQVCKIAGCLVRNATKYQKSLCFDRKS